MEKNKWVVIRSSTDRVVEHTSSRDEAVQIAQSLSINSAPDRYVVAKVTDVESPPLPPERTESITENLI